MTNTKFDLEKMGWRGERNLAFELIKSRPFKDDDVDLLFSKIYDNNFSERLSFVSELFLKGTSLSELFFLTITTKFEDSISCYKAFVFILNELLSNAETHDRAFNQLMRSANSKDEVAEGNSNFFRRIMSSSILSPMIQDVFASCQQNMLRDKSGCLISAEAVRKLHSRNKSIGLIGSALNHHDKEALDYVLSIAFKPIDQSNAILKAIRLFGCDPTFENFVLVDKRSISSYAKDMLDAIECGDSDYISRMFDPIMSKECLNELLPDIFAIRPKQCNMVAAYVFIKNAVNAKFDMYPSIIKALHGKYEALDILKGARLDPSQIISQILERNDGPKGVDYTVPNDLGVSAYHKDLLLVMLDKNDILRHERSKECFGKLFVVTGERDYLKHCSNELRGIRFESELGM